MLRHRVVHRGVFPVPRAESFSSVVSKLASQITSTVKLNKRVFRKDNAIFGGRRI